MPQYRNFYVQKTPFAFDETLTAFGLATVLQELLDKQGDKGSITIEDCGGYYALSLSQPLLAETVQHQSPNLMPRPALATDKTKLPDSIRAQKYEEVRDKVATFFNTPKDMRDSVEAPPREWDVYRALNPASLPGYNGLMSDWHTVRDSPEALMILLDLYSSFPNDFGKASEIWKALDKAKGWKISAEATRQQLYNPDSGKGQNKAKADGLSIGNVDSFWLSEWLKALGFYEVALTKLLRGSKDRKTIVLAPKKLSFERHQEIMADFVDSMSVSETSIRFDILAAIRYTRALLNYMLDNEDDPLFQLFGSVKDTLVGGFYTAFYKDMGNAVATMNLSFLGLPAWVNVGNRAEAEVYQEILKEIETIVYQFDESHSEDVILLQYLRDFISGDDFRPFLRFTTSYASFYMRRRERGYAVSLSYEFVERMVSRMARNLAELADREKHKGFHNIAAAIAQVTIRAQYNKDTSPYTIRYGLHRDLARQAQTPEKFAKAINEFIHSYNTETMRAMELGKSGTGSLINPEDIDDLLGIIGDFGNNSQLIAETLLAYGSTFTRFVKE